MVINLDQLESGAITLPKSKLSEIYTLVHFDVPFVCRSVDEGIE